MKINKRTTKTTMKTTAATWVGVIIVTIQRRAIYSVIYSDANAVADLIQNAALPGSTTPHMRI